MGKNKYILFTILLVLFHVGVVHATCDNSLKEQLQSEANAVEFSYEIIKNTTEEEYELTQNPISDTVIVRVKNVTPNLRISAVDEWGGEDELYSGIDFTITYSDTDNGTYEYEISAGALRHVIFTITSETDDCGTSTEAIKNMTIAGYNIFWLLDECQGSKAYYCQQYTEETISLSKEEVKARALSETKDKNDEAEEENEKEIGNILKENISVIMYVILGLIIVVIVIVVFFRKKGAK